MQEVKLNLGCGSEFLEGYVNVDYNMDDPRVTSVDLSAYPLPWATGSVDFILCSHVLEHLPDPMRFISECQRILRPGGEIVFKLPVNTYNCMHLRETHTFGYFWPVYHDEPGFTNGQSVKMFDLVYQKRHLRSALRLVVRLRAWAYNLISDEWEYRLKKPVSKSED
jgi:predicted SAM-dependent methyltransferase